MTSGLRIRAATASDLTAVTDIYAHAVLNGTASYEYDPPSSEEMEKRFAAIAGGGFPYLVATIDGRVSGYAYASHFRTRPAYRFSVEDSIYIAPDAQGQGLGTLLLCELIARCEAMGFRQMIAVIGGAEPASVATHAAAGFAHAGTMRAIGRKQGRWLDTVYMQRALGEGSETPPPLEPDRTKRPS